MPPALFLGGGGHTNLLFIPAWARILVEISSIDKCVVLI